jgi:hypothetical protein
MMKFSSTAVLLILSVFIAGSSWSGPSITPQPDIAATHTRPESVRLLPPVRGTSPLPATLIHQAGAAAAGDVWLTLVLGGVLVALQLRRTQRSARLSHLSP